MREIIPKVFKLETEKERLDFFLKVWSSDLFKKAAKNNQSLVGGLVAEFIKYPRYFYNMQDQVLERAAFTSWYNVLSLKEYKNPYIKDLYLLHELTHICSMPYNPSLNWDEWQNKMRENEVWASLVSEVFIYFEIPKLRKQTFKHPIWVDLFLNKPEFKDLSVPDLYAKFLPIRLKSYIEPKHELEHELVEYKRFSFLFYQEWKDFYPIIENQVASLKNKNQDSEFELFLKKCQSERGILFEDRVRSHQENYIKLNKIREQY